MKRLFSCLKCEEAGGVHSQFQALLAAVNEPRPGCSLTIANRLFGEITYPFFQVGGHGVHFNSSWNLRTQQNLSHHRAQREFKRNGTVRCLVHDFYPRNKPLWPTEDLFFSLRVFSVSNKLFVLTLPPFLQNLCEYGTFWLLLPFQTKLRRK